MESSDEEKLPVHKRTLFAPALDEIKNVVTPALLKNFSEVSVKITECPDLTTTPFNLAATGLSGNPSLLEIGGPAFLLPSVRRDKIYDIPSILKQLNHNEKAFIIGAGAGPWPQLSRNCEMMMNIVVSPTGLTNGTRLAWVGDQKQCILQDSAELDARCALLANLYMSEGKPGKVLEIKATKRLGNMDFIATMQQALAAHYRSQLIGLGGTFLLKKGKAKQHVMPDFSPTPLTTEKALNQWLHFYEMTAPLVAVGTFVSADCDLDLRVQHFHSFSAHGEGGHYHIDTTPDTVEYLGYFNVANSLYRIDQPLTKINFGKD